jgi:hypothetical protein
VLLLGQEVERELTQHLHVLVLEGKEAVDQQIISNPLAQRKREVESQIL